MTWYGRGKHLRGAPTIPYVATRHILRMSGVVIVLREFFASRSVRTRTSRGETATRAFSIPMAVLGGGTRARTVEEGDSTRTGPRLVEPVTARVNSRRKLGAFVKNR